MSDYTINMDEINDLSYEDLEKQMNAEANKAASGLVGLIDSNGSPVSLFEFKYNSAENNINITPTDKGKHFIMNAFGQPAIGGEAMSIDLDNVDPKVLGIVFGQNNTDNKMTRSFGDFIEKAQTGSGAFKIVDNQEALVAYAKRTQTLSNQDVVNSMSGHFGSNIESTSGTSNRFTTDTYDTGKLNGLSGVRIEGVRSNLSPAIAREESDKLAFEHAAHHALSIVGLGVANSDFHINPKTGLGVKLTHTDNLIVNASKSADGFTHRKSQWDKNSIELSFTDLKGLKTGNSENQTSKQAIQQVYRYLKDSNQKTKEAFITQLMLGKLIGSEQVTGDDIKFQGNLEGGKLKLKLLPIAGITPSLMHNPSHADLRERGLEDQSLSDMTIMDILNQDTALRNIYNVEPELIKSSFISAIAARREMGKYITQEMGPEGLVSSSHAFDDYLTRPLTGGGEYYLQSESIGQANNNQAMERLLERNLGDDSQLAM